MRCSAELSLAGSALLDAPHLVLVFLDGLREVVCPRRTAALLRVQLEMLPPVVTAIELVNAVLALEVLNDRVVATAGAMSAKGTS